MTTRCIPFVCLALSTFVLAGCGGSDDDNDDDGTAGASAQSTGGSTSSSSSSGGTRSLPTDGSGGSEDSPQTGGASGEPTVSATGGTAGQPEAASGGADSPEGAAGTAGAPAVTAGAGGAAPGTGGTADAGGAGPAGAAGDGPAAQGGQGGLASGGGGVAGASEGTSGGGGTEDLSACAPLCSDPACSAGAPDCLPEAFGLAAGDELPVCLPTGTDTATGVTWCTEPLCPGDEIGCPLTVHVGTLDWSLSPGTAPVHSDVAAAATITAIDGTLTASLEGVGSCDFTVDIPADTPVPINATGTLQPGAATELLSLSLSAVEVELDNVELTASATSESPLLCGIAAGELDTTLYEPDFEAGLLEAIQSQAEALTCLDCRPSCPNGIACTLE